jgi:predicted membrane chloride channel (bestrophin family)
MNKYLDIVNHRSLNISVLCIAVTYFCLRYNFSYDVDLIIFSIAIIFPLVFTIREAFRRRQNAIRLLSKLKASISAFYFSLENSNKLTAEEKQQVHVMMNALSETFIDGLMDRQNASIPKVREEVRELYHFVDTNRNSISGNASLKLIRLIQDIQECIENLNGIKIHGTPVSLRAYCLIFIYILPFIFTPTLVFNLSNHPSWIIYALSVLHGFILISLYNLQDHIEDPFDQMGLDDIKLVEFKFKEQLDESLVQEAVAETAADAKS